MKNKFGRCQTEEELHANVATGGTLCEPSRKIKTREFKDVNINYLYLHVNVHISSKLLIWDGVRANLYVFPHRGVTMLILRSIIRLRNRIRDSASIVSYFRPPDSFCSGLIWQRYILFQRSSFDLFFGKRVYSGRIWETKLLFLENMIWTRLRLIHRNTPGCHQNQTWMGLPNIRWSVIFV